MKSSMSLMRTKQSKLFAVLFLSILASLVCIFVIVGKWVPKFTAGWFSILLVMYAASHFLRLFRLRAMTFRLGTSWKNLFIAHFGSAPLGLIPFKIGDFARLFFLNLATGSLVRSTTLLLLERTLDAIVLCVITIALVPLLGIQLDSALPIVMAAVALCGCLIFFSMHFVVRRLSRRAIATLGDRNSLFTANRIYLVRRGLHFLKSALSGNILLIILCTVTFWSLEIIVASFVIKSGEVIFANSAFIQAFQGAITSSPNPDSAYILVVPWVLAAGGCVSLGLAVFMFLRGLALGTPYVPGLTERAYVIYDGSIMVPDNLVALSGVTRFADLYYRNATVGQVFCSIVDQSGLAAHLITSGDRHDLRLKLMEIEKNACFIYISSRVVITSAEVLKRFVKVGTLVESEYTDPAGSVAILKTKAACYDLLEGRQNGAVPIISLGSLGQDLAEKQTLGRLLSKNTDARHFNTLTANGKTFTKSSTDKEKIRKEYSYYNLLPKHMKSWFVEPYSFDEQADRASYTMRRVLLPNIASHWVQGAFDRAQFQKLLERLFEFIRCREVESFSLERANQARRLLYLEKIESRYEQLQKWELYERLDHAFSGISGCGTLQAIFKKYLNIYKKISPEATLLPLAVSHGDLCFSNILYDRDSQEMHLIDPRGALTRQELFIDPYYDICKLSHSILGNYDFINMLKFKIHVSGGMCASIVQEQPLPGWRSELFKAAVQDAGFDMRFVRLGEASLFLSMLPLHIDYPDKVLAFALVARDILQEIMRSQ